MKYQQPFGETDPDAAYENGDLELGVEGSIPPAASIEHPMREIIAAIEGAGLTPDEDVLDQLWQAVRPVMNYQAFNSPGSSSWTVPAGVRRVLAMVIGAGGGGGGGESSGAWAGGGGGSGAFGMRWCAVTPGDVVTVTRGAKGAGGAANSSGAAGGTGGTSSFGAFLSCTGGAGGTSGSVTCSGGAGGTASGGGFLLNGAYGGDGNPGSGTTQGGHGGASHYGGGGMSSTSAAGGNALVIGSGGGGIWGSSSQIGGAGADGAVSLFW